MIRFLALISALVGVTCATPIDLPHGGRLPGRIIASGDPAVVRVAADLFAEPLEFVAAAVGRSNGLLFLNTFQACLTGG